jgi:hypothetical protein
MRTEYFSVSFSGVRSKRRKAKRLGVHEINYMVRPLE